MAQCSYPTCSLAVQDDGAQWCANHAEQQCSFPPCQEHVIPASGFCLTHNDMAIWFDWLHNARHAAAVQQQVQAQQAQRIMQQVGNGRLLRP